MPLGIVAVSFIFLKEITEALVFFLQFIAAGVRFLSHDDTRKVFLEWCERCIVNKEHRYEDSGKQYYNQQQDA